MSDRRFFGKVFIALVFFAALACPVVSRAQPNRPGQQSPLPDVLNADEIAQRISDFRKTRLNGDFFLAFELVHSPRRGDRTHYQGMAWGTWNDQGPVTRFLLRPPVTDPAAALSGKDTWQWLVQNGASPKIWVLEPGAKAARELPVESWHQPLMPGTVYTPFDLLLPFLYWQKFTYEGVTHGDIGPADNYLMLPPQEGAGAVRVRLDRTYNALTHAEQIDAANKVAREFNLEDFKTVQEQTIPKSVRLQDKVTRDDDLFDVTAAALGLKLDPAIFDPKRLAEPAEPPPSKAITRF